MVLADHMNAEYALLMVRRTRNVESGIWRTIVRGECINALHIYNSSYQYIYGISSQLTAATPLATRVAGISLMSNQPMLDYSSDQPTIDLHIATGYNEIKPDHKHLRYVLSCMQYAGDDKDYLYTLGYYKPKKSVVTGRHHTWFTPTEVLRATDKSRLTILACALKRLERFEETEAFYSGFLLWSASAEPFLVWKVLQAKTLWAQKDLHSWIREAKAWASPLKAHMHYTELPLQQAFELQVLANRGLGEVNWTQEYENRVKPKLVHLDPLLIREEAYKIFLNGKAEGYSYATESWGNFWRRRWASVPSGSVHSQYKEDQAFISSEQAEKTKHYTVLRMHDRSINRWLKRTPKIVAWPSTKYEWAKNRAIYGTDLTSYLLTDFCMPAVEESLSHIFPVGRKANEEYVKQRIDLAAQGGVALCFDYEDFNSQHSLSSQAAIIQAFSDAFNEQMSDEQKSAIQWVRDSMFNQEITGKHEYRTRGTLLSGCRLTTLINTVLNYIYLKLATCMNNITDSVHNGDDVLAFTPTVSDSQAVMLKAHKIGIRAQPEKCVMGGLQEFLRVDRAATHPTGSQYLTRGIATAVHAPAESNEPDDLLGLIKAQFTRIGELQARGTSVDTCDKLRNMAQVRAANEFSTSLAVIQTMQQTHLVHGGLCDDPDIEPEYRITREKVETDEQDILKAASMPGVRDYAEYLITGFDLDPEQIPKAAANIARATVSLSKFMRRALIMEPVGSLKRAVAQQYLHKCSKDDYSVAAYTGKARLAGLPVGRLAVKDIGITSLARIQSSDDPIRTIGVIF